jgi:hypothetical protein
MCTEKTTKVYFAIYDGALTLTLDYGPGLSRIQSNHDKEAVGCNTPVYVVHCQGSISRREQT